MAPLEYLDLSVKFSASQEEAMLISEEIKSIGLAVLELCLSEGISKVISK